jgi:hypothetical protein
VKDEKQLAVYSGKCLQGICGEASGLEDRDRKPLFIGDIVIVSTIDSYGVCDNYGLSVVVCNKYESYQNGRIEVKDESKYFVMGIANVDFMEKDSNEWIVKKVKSYADCIDGEHWRAYGFNYKYLEGDL